MINTGMESRKGFIYIPHSFLLILSFFAQGCRLILKRETVLNALCDLINMVFLRLFAYPCIGLHLAVYHFNLLWG